jgi:uncharacterized membrane protein
VLFSILKWLHILSAIIAVGANITYGAWLAQAGRHPESLVFTLRGIQFVDSRVANRAYGALLGTGLLMLWVGQIPLTVPWLLTALVLYLVLLLGGIFVYAPAFRRQISLAESVGMGDPKYQEASRRAAWMGAAVTVVAIVITFLMVVKPALWG